MAVSSPSACNAYILASGDLFSLGLAFIFGRFFFEWTRGTTVFSGTWYILHLFISLVAVAWFWSLGHYTRRKPFWDELRDIFKVASILFILEAATLFVAKSDFPRLWFLSACLSAFLILPLARIAIKRLLICFGKWQLPTVIVGAGPNAVDAAAALASDPLLGFQVSDFLAMDDSDLSRRGYIDFDGRRIPVTSLTGDPLKTLLHFRQKNFVVALEPGGLQEQAQLLDCLQYVTNNLHIVPALRGLPLYGLEVNHFFRHEVLLLRVRNNLSRRIPRIIKRSFDLVASILLLVALAPLFLYLIWRISRDGGAAIFAHDRIGWQGKVFRCYKFRTMVMDAEVRLKEILATDPQALVEWELDFKLKDDPRVTDVGRFLRRTSLDELPQLWNVVKGEMSLVGPRPIVQEELARYGRQAHLYLVARPGMTGLWQVSGRNDTDYSRRVNLDVWYVKNWSMWYDISILFKTLGVVFGKKGAY